MAQEAAQEEVDEAEFAAASAAVSRLTEVFSPSRVLQPSLAAQVRVRAVLWDLHCGARPRCGFSIICQGHGCVTLRDDLIREPQRCSAGCSTSWHLLILM